MMTEDRERQLLRHIPTLDTMDELLAFRAAIQERGEQLTTELTRSLDRRIAELVK